MKNESGVVKIYNRIYNEIHIIQKNGNNDPGFVEKCGPSDMGPSLGLWINYEN